MIEDKLRNALEKTEYYLDQIITTKRGYIQNLCIISAAVASFSMPLFTSSHIDRPLLLLGIAYCAIVIIVGTYLLKVELEKENDIILKIREALSTLKIKSLDVILSKNKNGPIKKDYTLDLMVYPLCGGVISILLSLLFGVIKG